MNDIDQFLKNSPDHETRLIRYPAPDKFRDWMTSTLTHPTYTYRVPGDNTVTLSVSGPGGVGTEVGGVMW